KEYGMSTRMGLSSYERPRNPFLRGDSYFPTEKEYSERIASEIDEEVKLFLEKAHATARQIIESRRTTVEALATLLLEKEVVDREEFIKLVDGKTEASAS
ncbi:MAG TPA: cell division protein FtsH, partial [Spirochaetia bacterium]|nr:cell division protein FtsH [Spirochaetia bacterium]